MPHRVLSGARSRIARKQSSCERYSPVPSSYLLLVVEHCGSGSFRA